MQAVILSAFGAPDQLVAQELADPEPGPGQVLIEVAAASVTFVETQVRAGRGPSPAHQPALPMVPGNGVGGVVIAIGEDVDPHWLGARVVSTTGGSGGYAELAVAAATAVVAVPEGVDLLDAVALLADGRTAIGLTQLAPPRAGEWTLVEAAGGGVGGLLVQLAHSAGAHVIGAASPGKLTAARAAGADVTVDYTDVSWDTAVRAAAPSVELAFDGVGGDIGRTALSLIRDGGRFCVHGMASGSMTVPDPDDVRQRRLTIVGLNQLRFDPETIRELSRQALVEAAAGRLRATIGQTFPLHKAAAAHTAIEARSTVGKTLLIPSARS